MDLLRPTATPTACANILVQSIQVKNAKIGAGFTKVPLTEIILCICNRKFKIYSLFQSSLTIFYNAVPCSTIPYHVLPNSTTLYYGLHYCSTMCFLLSFIPKSYMVYSIIPKNIGSPLCKVPGGCWWVLGAILVFR